MGRIWLKVPVLWHGHRKPKTHIAGLTDKEVAFIRSKWHNWYSADWDYGQTTVAFFCAGIAWLLILNVIFRLRSRLASSSSTRLSILDRLTAACRYTVASQYRIKFLRWYSPPLAALIGLAGMFTFVMSLMLAVRPYYWPKHAMGHSMPIATRSGWIAMGIMPFMIAFSTKINWIGLLTGTSHEKLQVFHRWSAMFMYITSLVHTFPFIVMSIRRGEMEKNWSTSHDYWTGVVALVPQTWLVFMSWGFIRNPYYETFKKLHFTAGIVFMVFLFLHCNFVLTSWDYFWPTIALYLLAFFTRIFRTLYNSALGLPASLELPTSGMLRVTIQTPSRFKWTPGQHVFVRFINLGVHAFSSHPFTIASIPSMTTRSQNGQSDTLGQLELVITVKGGITKKLAGLVKDKPAKVVRVWVDGPYGGVPGRSLGKYDSVYLLTGGSGISFTLPILMDLVRQAKASELKCKHVEFILAVKHTDYIIWLEDRLVAARECGFIVNVYVTQENVSDDHSVSKLEMDKGINDSNRPSDKSIDHHDSPQGAFGLSSGRPNLPAIIHTACQTHSGLMAIAACGPDSFLYDVRNAVADCQLAIADGYGKCQDLFLHTENYSW